MRLTNYGRLLSADVNILVRLTPVDREKPVFHHFSGLLY